HLRPEAPRRYGIYTNVMPRPLDGKAARHLPHSAFTDGVERNIRDDNLEGDGADINDLSFALLSHDGRGFLTGEKCPFQVNRHDALPIRFRESLCRLADIDAGGVD